MMEDWPNGPWWQKALGVFGMLALLLILAIIGGVVDVGINYFGVLSKTHPWLEHVFWIGFTFIYSSLATMLIVALYEGVYHANPRPPIQMTPEQYDAYEADRNRRQNRALNKTCLVVSLVAIGLYLIRIAR